MKKVWWSIIILIAKGHIPCFFPKELNPIERVLAQLKQYTKAHCKYFLPSLCKNTTSLQFCTVLIVSLPDCRPQIVHTELGDSRYAYVNFVYNYFIVSRNFKTIPSLCIVSQTMLHVITVSATDLIHHFRYVQPKPQEVRNSTGCTNFL